jgi:16S rRNA (guanine527-N7)-methyltransferase
VAPRSTGPPIDAAARLRSGARSLGVELDDECIASLVRYLDELDLWNARVNLVGEHDRRTLIDRHVVDALAAVPLLRALGPELRIADLGSGAGLPGVPLAIAIRPREMCLIEPRRKRANFLRNIRRVLPGLGLHVLEERAEDVALRDECVARFDAVVSRATLGDEELQACAAPLLKDGGLLVAYRGVIDSEQKPIAPGSEFSRPFTHAYSLWEARREFRLDSWTRCFT